MSDSDDDIYDPAEATRVIPPLHEAIRNNEGQFPTLTKLTMVTSNFIGWSTLGIIKIK